MGLMLSIASLGCSSSRLGHSGFALCSLQLNDKLFVNSEGYPLYFFVSL